MLDIQDLGLPRSFMAFLGRITKFLLVLAVLPWGAYSVAGTSPSVVWVDMISVAQLVDLTDRADVGSRDPDLAIVAPVKKRCRTAALFGSPCGPDVTLSATKVVFGNPTSRPAVFRDPAGWLAGVEPSGPHDPPRSR